MKILRLYQIALVSLALLGCGAPSHPPASSASQNLEDFDALWRFVDERYPFFADKATDWQRVRALYRPRAAEATDRRALLHVLEATLDELYDPHNMLNSNTADSWRPVPHDLYVEEREGRFFVTGVRGGAAAALAGARVGFELLAIDGRPVEEAMASRMPRTLVRPDAAARQWTLLSAVAGRHGHERRLQVRAGGEIRELRLDAPGGDSPEPPLIEHRLLQGGLGYIRIRSFADDAAVAQFDVALAQLRDTRALLIDVRDNGGGDTAVARPIMGRFVAEQRPYAWMARREGTFLGPRWSELVEPRGPWTYTAPVVVLVDRFSVSMAEGFAMGLSGMKRARIVGTRMAGLGAAIERITLRHSGIGAQISAEPVYHVDGTPRWQLVPDVEVDVLAGGDDPILAAARSEAERLLYRRDD